MKQDIKSLIDKHIAGKSTADDIRSLREALRHEPKGVEEAVEQAWMGYRAPNVTNRKARREIAACLSAAFEPKHISMGGWMWRAAAAVLLPLLVGVAVWRNAEKRHTSELAAQIYTVTADKSMPTIVLPDSTVVYLNANARLSYPAGFALDRRVVSLSGEAYFKVSHDAQRPFTVQTTDMDVRVLGTTFNLNAPADAEWVEVSLVEGRVLAIPTDSAKRSVTLKAGQQIRYNLSLGKFEKAEANMQAATAWTRGELYFNHDRLQTILEKAATFYGLQLEIEGQCPAETFTGSFCEDDIQPILLNLQQHYRFTYSRIGKKLRVWIKN